MTPSEIAVLISSCEGEIQKDSGSSCGDSPGANFLSSRDVSVIWDLMRNLVPM